MYNALASSNSLLKSHHPLPFLVFKSGKHTNSLWNDRGWNLGANSRTSWCLCVWRWIRRNSYGYDLELYRLLVRWQNEVSAIPEFRLTFFGAPKIFGNRNSHTLNKTLVLFPGVGKYLKEKNPNVGIYAVEPAESQVINGKPHTPHKIQGTYPEVDYLKNHA